VLLEDGPIHKQYDEGEMVAQV